MNDIEYFTGPEKRRYCRHFALPEIGPAGQKKIKSAKIAVVGAGGLGSPALLYLAAAGAGGIGIIDDGTVEISNLQRQVLFSSEMEGRRKTECCLRRLSALNPEIKISVHSEKLSAENGMRLLEPYDVVLDCSDNFICKYLVNDACSMLGKPDVSGSVYRFDGQISVFNFEKGPCYRCLYPEVPPDEINADCAQTGIFGPVPGIIGVLQALEALKIITGSGEVLAGRLLIFSGLAMEFETVNIAKNKNCPLCGGNSSIVSLQNIKSPRSCGNSIFRPRRISPEELKSVIEEKEKIIIWDVRCDWEHELCRIEGAVSAPLDALKEKTAGLDMSERIIVYCKDESRSLKAAGILENAGFKHVRVLTGGIDAWAEKIDKKMLRY